MNGGKAKEIALGDELGDLAFSANTAMVEFHADGSIAAYTKSDVDAYTNGAVRVHPAVGEDAKPAVISVQKPGDRMSDGTIFAGISPDTQEPMYTTPRDAPLTYTFNQARKYAAKLEAHGQHDWRVPTKRELAVLFKNRAAIGGFNITGWGSAGWYRSSSHNSVIAWTQRFSDGNQYGSLKDHELSLRCIR